MRFKLLLLVFLIVPGFVYAGCCDGSDFGVDCVVNYPCEWDFSPVQADSITINAETSISEEIGDLILIAESISINEDINGVVPLDKQGANVVLQATEISCSNANIDISGTDGETGDDANCWCSGLHYHVGCSHSHAHCNDADDGGDGSLGRGLILSAEYIDWSCTVESVGGSGGVGGDSDSHSCAACYNTHSASGDAGITGDGGDGGSIIIRVSDATSSVETSGGINFASGLSPGSSGNPDFTSVYLAGGSSADATPGVDGTVSVEAWPGYNSSCLPVELCNNQDDNCDDDNLVDEGLENCKCTNGDPSNEVCNGIDDNCDGLIDNDCVELRIPCIPSSLPGEDCADFNYDEQDFKKWVLYGDSECPFDVTSSFLDKVPCLVVSRYVDNYKRYDNKRKVLETISHFKFYNKIFNSDFSKGTVGWSGSLSLSDNSLFNGMAVQGSGSTNVDVEPNKNYVLSGYTQGGSFSVSCSGEAASLGDSGSFVEGGWIRYYQVLTTGSGTATCEISLNNGLFDGIQFSEGSEVIDYDSGLFSVKYAYDNKDRLISKLNPVGVGEAHAYDLMNNDRFSSINNLIPDPSFELNENSFLYWQGPFGYDSDARSGNKAILANSNNYETLKYLLPVFPRKEYVLSAFVKGGGNLGLRIKFFDREGNYISETSDSVSTPGSYERRFKVFTTPQNADLVEVGFGKVSGSSIRIDDVSLNQGNEFSNFKLVEYTYNSDSTINTVTYDDGFVVSNFEYTPRRWIDSLETSCIIDDDSYTILNEDYDYDESGNLERITYPVSGDYVSFGYDGINRLESVDDEGYFGIEDFEIVYGVAGNRLSKGDLSYVYYDREIDNRLKSDGAYIYEYEVDGSVSQRTFVLEDIETYGSGADLFGGNTTFDYYATGLLRSVTFPFYKGIEDSVRYYYDSGNNLAVRKTPYGTTFYVYDDFGDLVYERMDGSDIRRCEIEEEFNEAGRKFIVKEGNTGLAVFDDTGYVKIKGSIIINSDFDVDKYFSVEKDSINWLIDSSGNLHLKEGWDSLIELGQEFDQSIDLNTGFFITVGEEKIAAISDGGMQVLGCVAMFQDVDQYLE